jgi:hypothetical protein
MEEIFPDMAQQNENTIAFSIGENGFSKPRILSLLIRPTEKGVELFRKTSGLISVKTQTYTSSSNNTKKLFFRIEFKIQKTMQGFESIIDCNSIAGKSVIEVLKLSDEVIIWIADKECKVVKVLSMMWDGKKINV